MTPTLGHLWKEAGFTPNEKQKAAIETVDGPLLLTAGPGSGKTRVLLWRTLNLIVFHNVDPQDIFLSTFTEKAARQLKDGLRSLLGFASNYTNKPYDIARMSIGTVHSICQQIITDRRFSENGERVRSPLVMDELGQYFKLYQRSYWRQLLSAAGYGDSDEEEVEAHRSINQFFHGRPFGSRHAAVLECKALFNRFSEENLNPSLIKTKDPVLKGILKMYEAYLRSLTENGIIEVDLSLLQQAAYKRICNDSAKSVYKHIIIDEYQDTNAIQEKIFFKLAGSSKNICVVGDDDQALYRFRGATVENLVEFEKRCKQYIGRAPKRIDLDINYRSRKQIVDLYSDFVNRIDWRKNPKTKEHYRVHDKVIQAHSKDAETAVVISDHCKSPEVFKEIAAFVKQLKAKGKIKDYNQCAFLFPSLKGSSRVAGFKKAFEEIGIDVYAPRAGNFFDVPEVKEMLGCMLNIFAI
jgi:DNA helicase-2/ATP-dependent DNA helicase PcrA